MLNVYFIKPKFDEIIRVILNKPLFYCTYMFNYHETQRAGKTNKGHRVVVKKFFICRSKILDDLFFLVPMTI